MRAAFAIILGLLFAWNAWMFFFRNNQVYHFRKALIDRILEISLSELQNNGFVLWDARVRVMKETSYGDMIWCFWRAPETFYRGTMLEKIAVDAARRTTH